MAETDFKYDVFISYSHKDEAWADKILRQRLDDAGLRVCIDYRDFEAGKMALLNMQDAVKQSKHVVLVLTRNWLNSEWSLFEALVGGTKDPAGLQKKLIPLLCEVGIEKDINDFIAMRTWVDFTRKDREDIAWKQLFAALGKPEAFKPSNLKLETPSRDTWHLAHPYPMPPNFTGRAAEQTILDDWLADNTNRLFILRALGGFGKSALTWQWINTHVNPTEWTHVVWWSFYEGDASFEHFIEETLKYLKLSIPQGGRPQVDELLKAMQSQKILLVMDGFERALRAYSSMNAAYQADESPLPEGEGKGEGDSNQLDCVNINAEFFLKGICSLPNINSKVLMTTRLTPRAIKPRGEFMLGCREVELTSMQPVDAVEFFHKQKIKGTHAEIEAACAPYGYHPLSLRLLAGRILKDFENPADIVVAQTLKIDGKLKAYQHHVLEVSYNSLPEHEQKLLSTIACFRSPVELTTLQSIAENKDALDNGLHDLVERGLLHFDEKNKKFDLHPIVRYYTYKEFSNRKEIHKQLVQHFQKKTEFKAHWVGGSQYSWHPRGVEDIDDLALFIELYHHTVQIGELDNAYRALRPTLDILVNQLGANQIAVELLRVFFLGGEDNPPHLEMSDTRIQAQEYLANAYVESGQPRRALLLYKAIDDYEKEELARVYISIGAIHDAQNYLQHQIESLRYSSFQSFFYGQDESEKAILHCELGSLYSYCGEWEKAEKEFSKVFTIPEKIEKLRSPSLMWGNRAYHVLRMIREHLQLNEENHRSAINFAQQALNLAKKDGLLQIEGDLIRAHWLLGAAHLVNNNTQQAEYHLIESLSRDRAINMIHYEANILLDLARLRYDQKNYEESKSLADEALLITERCGYVLQGADVNLFLAQYALEQEKDKVKAKAYAEEALKLATCDGPPYYYKVAYEEAERFLENLK